VASISAKDWVLYLWATEAVLTQALAVMKAWGFNYVSNAM
jgi:N6-adenosine-specific RNA methylase IME4